MGRLIDESDLIKSLFDYTDGKKTLGQCIDDTPTAQPEQQWIPCSECINYIDERCVVANHHVSEKENCMEVFGAKRRTVERRRIMCAGVKRKIEECWKHIKNYLDDSVYIQAIDDFPELKAMCNQCEAYCGKEHDYVECREKPCFICWLALEYLEWSDGYE